MRSGYHHAVHEMTMWNAGLTHRLEDARDGNMRLIDSHTDAQHPSVLSQDRHSYILCHVLYEKGWLSLHHLLDIPA